MVYCTQVGSQEEGAVRMLCLVDIEKQKCLLFLSKLKNKSW